MCQICRSIEKENMTAKEVARAWREQPPSDRHLEDALEVLSKSPIYTDIIEEIFFLESEDEA